MTCDLFMLATEGVRTLQPYQPGKPIEELEREMGLCDIVKLASNENPLGPGAGARAAVARSIDSLGRYPDGNGFALKRALAVKLGVSTDSLTLGNGSNDVLELITRAFVTPDHEIVFSEHAFAVYPLVTRAVGARAVVTPAREWGHDAEAMGSAVTDRTRVIFVANPNNPTGTWVTVDSLTRLLNCIPENVLVVIDEAYSEYVQVADYPNCVPWVAEHPNLIVTRTFSKAYGLAGLRVGYAVSHPVVADLLNRVRQPFNANQAALVAAEASLQDSTHLTRSLAVNRAGMMQLETAFNELGLDYIPSVANFISVDVGGDGIGIYEALLGQGVIVRPVGNYGMPKHLRVTVGLEHENARFIEALETILNSEPS